MDFTVGEVLEAYGVAGNVFRVGVLRDCVWRIPYFVARWLLEEGREDSVGLAKSLLEDSRCLSAKILVEHGTEREKFLEGGAKLGRRFLSPPLRTFLVHCRAPAPSVPQQ